MSLIIFERVDFVLKKILFKGVGTAIATPFNSDGVNIPAFEKLLSFQLLNSVDSIIVCGTTGEASTMSDDEKSSIINVLLILLIKKFLLLLVVVVMILIRLFLMLKWLSP